ncbi:unnamed protein product [Acanthocheilonema viteae]|uniref:Uncharacterized protein n=1 Tax=Acanthocheilonema viteae TaxID=6277 RepID=A0A498STR4_ACAVI|nr:unnamed protein product [Acanthocheilonema viteae]
MKEDLKLFSFGNQVPEFYPTTKDNYGLCLGRLRTLIKRLQNSKPLLNRCNEIFKKQMQLNIIEEVKPDMNQVGVIHYLPHHEVLTPANQQ